MVEAITERGLQGMSPRQSAMGEIGETTDAIMQLVSDIEDRVRILAGAWPTEQAPPVGPTQGEEGVLGVHLCSLRSISDKLVDVRTRLNKII